MQIMIKSACSISLSSNMSQDSSDKYYQNNKERLQRNLVNDWKFFLKKEKKTSDNMVLNNTKVYQKVKNESLLVIEKKIMKWAKTTYYNCKKLLFFSKNNKVFKFKKSFDEE